MTNIDEELSRYGLTRTEYELCLKDIQMKLSGTMDIDWSEIIEKYHIPLHRDTLKKAANTIFGGVFVSEYMKSTAQQRSQLSDLRLERNAIKKERQKLSDEKAEYRKWLREDARSEAFVEKLDKAIREMEPLDEVFPTSYEPNQREGILCYADAHYGVEFELRGLHGEILNRYSPEIFERRMEELLGKTIAKVQAEGLTRIHVYSLGDELDGILRASQLMKLRYGVVEATVRYAEYISRWLHRLSQSVRVEFQMALGNHTELRMIGQPKGTFPEDNMGNVIYEFIKLRLEADPNFSIERNPSGLIYDSILGYNVLGIHGEVKNLSSAIQNFSNIYNTGIDILIAGHKHHAAAETVGDHRDVVSVPSIIGADNYSLSIGKMANPGATFLMIEDGYGIIEQSTFKFRD